MWTIHTMEYDSARKECEVLTQATAWTTLENMMLSERSQSPKTTCCIIPLQHMLGWLQNSEYTKNTLEIGVHFIFILWPNKAVSKMCTRSFAKGWCGCWGEVLCLGPPRKKWNPEWRARLSQKDLSLNSNSAPDK